MTVPNWIATFALQAALIVINAFFAATELAVMQLSPSKLRRWAEDGDKAAARVLRLAENPSAFLSTIQVGITLAGFFASAFAASSLSGPLTAWLRTGLGFTQLEAQTVNTLSIIIITLLLSYFTLVFGELVPKRIAIYRPYPVAKFGSGVILVLGSVLKPLVKLLSLSTNAVLRLIGIRETRSEESVTEDEIRMMVDVGHESGNIDPEEKQMIDNVFELDKTIARDVMTHRVDVVAIEADAGTDEIVEIISASGMSRFPVYNDSMDDILGVLSSRMYLLNLRKKQPQGLRALLRPARFVPETVRADVLLRDMQKYKDHLAVVLDEYGGFSGVVTMEDLIEEIVGSIYDEFDAVEDEGIVNIGENMWRVAGDTAIEQIEKELGVALPEQREYDSLGGLVFSVLSAIPADGERVEVEVEGLHISTEPVQDHHVQWAKVSLISPQNQAAGPGAGSK